MKLLRRTPKDPNEQVRAALDVLAQQHAENNRRGLGLVNMPKHARAKEDLVRLGSAGVPALLEALAAPRADRETPQGEIEDGVAHDVADVLGRIGDPRVVQPLMAQFRNYIVTCQSALSRFPEGVEALLVGLDHPDQFHRSCCISGLGMAEVDRQRAALGLTRALADREPNNRRQAAMSARILGVRDAELLAALARAEAEDPEQRVRDKAYDALRALGAR